MASDGTVVVIGGTGGSAGRWRGTTSTAAATSWCPAGTPTAPGRWRRSSAARRAAWRWTSRARTRSRPLADVGAVDHLVLAAIDRDQNTAADFDIAQALNLATLKLVGYTEVVHALESRISPEGSIVLFGGVARFRPYPGSTTVSTVNAGMEGLMRTLSVELAPVRVNCLHPGIVGDSPFWSDKPAAVLEGYRSGTLTGRLASMADIVDAVAFLTENPSVNGVSLLVDGGWK